MTYLVLIVIANPACWLQQGVKRSPTRRTRTGSIRSHTRRGQLRNQPTNYASLPITYFFSFVIANPAGRPQRCVKRSPTRGMRTGSIRSCTRRRQLRNPPTNYASLPMTTLFSSSLPQRDAYGANPALVCRASGEAIPCPGSGSNVHAVYILEGMAS